MDLSVGDEVYDDPCPFIITAAEDRSDLDSNQLDVRTSVPIQASPYDSVSDLEALLRTSYGLTWGTGTAAFGGGGGSSVGGGAQAHAQTLPCELCLVFRGQSLSYHLFLCDYGVGRGDTIHAVVRSELEG
jgi:hypothetical protein